MHRQLIACPFSFAAATTVGQGLINFQNTSTTLVSAGQVGNTQPINSPPGSYYFALLTNSEANPPGSIFSFAGVYATNETLAGLFSGGASVAIPGWQPGDARIVEIAGWSADLGHDWNPAWQTGAFPSASATSVFGISGEGVVFAGDSSPVWGPGNLFSGSNIDGIISGFNLAPVLQYTGPVDQTNVTILRSFSGNPDGAVPVCALVDGKDGAFYGTTLAGGISDSGAVFKVNMDGSGLAILKRFSGSDGANPEAGLVLGSNNELFGTTYAGGGSNLGTIFRLAKDGSDFSMLHTFTGGPDGKNPQAALIQGSDGALYGTAGFVDTSTRGTIFRLNPDGSGYSVIHIFTGNPDGQQPAGKLLEGSDGRLYGATSFGGPTVLGTVYSLQKDGSGYTILYSFHTRGEDGVSPGAGVVEGSDGVLYGTTSDGGTAHGGTVFKINKDGSGYGILYNFSDRGNDAYGPSSELIEESIAPSMARLITI